MRSLLLLMLLTSCVSGPERFVGMHIDDIGRPSYKTTDDPNVRTFTRAFRSFQLGDSATAYGSDGTYYTATAPSRWGKRVRQVTLTLDDEGIIRDVSVSSGGRFIPGLER